MSVGIVAATLDVSNPTFAEYFIRPTSLVFGQQGLTTLRLLTRTRLRVISQEEELIACHKGERSAFCRRRLTHGYLCVRANRRRRVAFRVDPDGWSGASGIRPG
jgi:hypothetical protein